MVVPAGCVCEACSLAVVYCVIDLGTKWIISWKLSRPVINMLLPIAAFVPLKELIGSLSPEKRERWERLYMLSDRQSMLTHPLIYPHPVTKLPVSISMWIQSPFPFIFKTKADGVYNLFYFAKKQGLAFHVNHLLSRHFIWKQYMYFLERMEKKNVCCCFNWRFMGYITWMKMSLIWVIESFHEMIEYWAT